MPYVLHIYLVSLLCFFQSFFGICFFNLTSPSDHIYGSSKACAATVKLKLFANLLRKKLNVETYPDVRITERVRSAMS